MRRVPHTSRTLHSLAQHFPRIVFIPTAAAAPPQRRSKEYFMMHKTLPVTLSFVLAATLAAGPLAFAQAPQQPVPDAQSSTPQQAPNAAPARTPDPHRRAMRIAKQLNLTPDQTSKLEPILADRDQKIAALRADTSIAPSDAKKQMHAIQQSTRSQLSRVLTPDQLNQLKSMQRAHAHQGQGQDQPTTAPTA